MLLIDATFRRLIYDRRTTNPETFHNMPAAIADILDHDKHILAEVRMNATIDDAIGTHNAGMKRPTGTCQHCPLSRPS